MNIFYSPEGMPVQVPITEEKTFLRLGYQTKPPKKAAKPPAEIFTSNDPPVSVGHVETQEPAPADLTVGVKPVNLNSASLKLIASLPSVSTATARLVINHRPFADIEELIANVKVDGVDWTVLRELILFEDPDDKS